MKIGFDAKRLFNNFTGLGNYSRFVVDTLLEAGTTDNYCLYTPKIKNRPETKRYLQDPHLKIITPPSWMKPSPLAAIWRSTLLISAKEFSSLDVYHGLSHELPMGIPSHVKTIVTIHDLIFLRYPQFYSRFDVMMHHQKVKHACKVADRIVAVSEQTASDIIQFLKADPAKIKVIYQGCHRQFRHKHRPEEIAAVRKKYDLPERYILMLGSIESRKNAITLLKAFAMLPKDGRPGLVLVGKGTTYLDQVKSTIAALHIEKEVALIHHAAFSDLPAIYQGATVFAYPSLFEGFGIPIIEAIESGIPVLTSKGSCFAEAGGPHAWYADPHQPEEWASLLKEILGSDNQQRIASQQEHVLKFRPEQNRENLLNSYLF
jgi:glycosyltransferase involved in cell wall biosynthesis